MKCLISVVGKASVDLGFRLKAWYAEKTPLPKNSRNKCLKLSISLSVLFSRNETLDYIQHVMSIFVKIQIQQQHLSNNNI